MGSFDKNGLIKTKGIPINGASLSSASLLAIPYLYMKSMGTKGLL